MAAKNERPWMKGEGDLDHYYLSITNVTLC